MIGKNEQVSKRKRHSKERIYGRRTNAYYWKNQVVVSTTLLRSAEEKQRKGERVPRRIFEFLRENWK